MRAMAWFELVGAARLGGRPSEAACESREQWQCGGRVAVLSRPGPCPSSGHCVGRVIWCACSECGVLEVLVARVWRSGRWLWLQSGCVWMAGRCTPVWRVCMAVGAAIACDAVCGARGCDVVRVCSAVAGVEAVCVCRTACCGCLAQEAVCKRVGVVCDSMCSVGCAFERICVVLHAVQCGLGLCFA